MFFLQESKIQERSDQEQSSVPLMAAAGEPGHPHSGFKFQPVGKRGLYYRISALNPSTGYSLLIQQVGQAIQVWICDGSGYPVSKDYFHSWQEVQARRVGKRLLRKAQRGIFTRGTHFTGFYSSLY